MKKDTTCQPDAMFSGRETASIPLEQGSRVLTLVALSQAFECIHQNTECAFQHKIYLLDFRHSSGTIDQLADDMWLRLYKIFRRIAKFENDTRGNVRINISIKYNQK